MPSAPRHSNPAGKVLHPTVDTVFTWSATGLPPGLTINATTGVISGTISSTASITKAYSVKVSAKDANAVTGTASFSWTVK
ncbi:MAG: hypothetical protein RJB26_783 [Pseudomonadota bacterium]